MIKEGGQKVSIGKDAALVYLQNWAAQLDGFSERVLLVEPPKVHRTTRSEKCMTTYPSVFCIILREHEICIWVVIRIY